MEDKFHVDLDYANQRRERLDKLYYPAMSKDGRFVPVERSPGSLYIQREIHIDCIAASTHGGSVTIEEKIVRWPGYHYTAITVETHSNLERTQHAVIGDGWIATSRADYLLYAFEQHDQCLRVWIFRLPLLRRWFAERVTQYAIADTANKFYTTRCRVVPLKDIPSEIVKVKNHLV